MPHSDRWATGIPAAHAFARWLQEGWIEFADQGRSAVKGDTPLLDVITALVGGSGAS
jgi:hypothetical protein